MSLPAGALRAAGRAIRQRRLCQRGLARTTATNRTSDQVRLVEVGPRDGLQNEKQTINLATKIELIERLAQTGLRTIEAGSFVSPKWVPQMANSSEILERLLRRPPSSAEPILYQFLVPNTKGLENFVKVKSASQKQTNGQRRRAAANSESYPTPPPSPSEVDIPVLDTSSQDPNAVPAATPTSSDSYPTPRSDEPDLEISVFTAATETFSQKNTNCSIAESLDRFRPVIDMAKKQSLGVRAYISVALGCPYEGPDVDPHKVAALATELLEMGADEISVGDTTGMGTAPRTSELLRTLAAAGVKTEDLALHLHDTFGQALVNAMVGLEHGIRTFDAAVAGLGGCPFSPGATGNVATEDLVHCFESLGARTGVDLERLSDVGNWISGQLGRPNESRAGKATVAKRSRKQAHETAEIGR